MLDEKYLPEQREADGYGEMGKLEGGVEEAR